ncbi:phospholipid/cholesterol/gamma-HCH transport system substrate-binding protein [Haloechinothrix alba]|uniref:Phospholipid/cholesterol/gamma-HCH transport system substrate-binding protein n=1 Tax=Haloechinothrix alba TaxID=664784 RepID=A0A238XPC6_9PSEU|nr:MlaD family protein [Haloechinothrix alba]SNR60438.1 phospholipid/cholesterol/gamma-HCH transport system substrate-binding protein [Haloechinothrix alba]
MALTKWAASAAVSALVLVGGGVVLATGVGDESYELRTVMGNAATLKKGTPVRIDGFDSGMVTSVSTKDGEAVVDLAVDDEHAPVPSGTEVEVRWKAALGERVVELVPGPEGNAEMPSGSMVPVAREQVDVDDVLATLDPETREHVASMVQGLDETTGGRAEEVNSLLEEGGPAVDALGEVLKAVGEDGHAIRELVSNVRDMMEPLTERQDELRTTVTDLASTTDAMAVHHEQLGEGLEQLPATMEEASRTLDAVPSAVDETVPLLEDLQAATAQLPSAAQQLSPLLEELRPAVGELRPTLESASSLLQRTPTLLDSSHDVLPGLNETVDQANPAVDFVRPYTPDLMGWLSNWAGAFGNYDANGNVAAAVIRAGVSSFDENPGLGLTMNLDPAPPPGKASDEPWTDAHGSEMR